MPEYVTSRCLLKCGFGDRPVRCQSRPLPGKRASMEAFDAATILNMIPVVNIPAFGICPSLANPQVAAATAVALTLDVVPVRDPGVLGTAFADRLVGWRGVCDGAMQIFSRAKYYAERHGGNDQESLTINRMPGSKEGQGPHDVAGALPGADPRRPRRRRGPCYRQCVPIRAGCRR